LLEPVGRNTAPALTAAPHTRATVDKRKLSPIEVQAGANVGKDEYERLLDA
jgi:mannose-1-phosphate guanylyltransferase